MTTVSPWTDHAKLALTTINVDSTTAISMACRESSTPRMKHIDLKYHHVRNLVQRGIIVINKVHTSEQVADGLTKVATDCMLERMICQTGLNFTA